MSQVKLNQDAKQRPPIVRAMVIGINVPEPVDLPKVGRQLSKFIANLDNDHGTFDITLDVNIGGYAKPLSLPGTTINNFHGDTDDYEGVD